MERELARANVNNPTLFATSFIFEDYVPFAGWEKSLKTHRTSPSPRVFSLLLRRPTQNQLQAHTIIECWGVMLKPC
ncbi:hypothetical protein PM082_003527 [Marasmius tenuissimus]|nr:hypothetical protein PM082_003527 [Marasmius tenuissimus]